MASGPGIRYAQRIGFGTKPCGPGVSSHRTVAGQAMVLGLALILVLCLGIVLLFNTGQVVNKKVELVNAADAAAYNVAIQQARALNYAAYMNRARVANEVAVAQTISLYSWLNQMHTTSIVIRTTLDVLSAIPYIGVVFKALATAFKVAERILKVTRQAFQPVAQAAIIAIDKLNMMFAASVQLVIEGVSRLDSYTIARMCCSGTHRRHSWAPSEPRCSARNWPRPRTGCCSATAFPVPPTVARPRSARAPTASAMW